MINGFLELKAEKWMSAKRVKEYFWAGEGAIYLETIILRVL